MQRLPLHRLLMLASGVALAAAIAAPPLSAQAPKAPDTIILKGAPMGGVKFDHKLHAKDAASCKTCHHPSKPEMPNKSEFQACTDCHSKQPAAAPLKTGKRDAFHDAMAKKGTCIDCHAKEAAAGKKAPVKCQECHKKENA
jgi:hypothetical protein